MSSFGVNYGPDGSDLKVAFEYRMAGVSMDDAIAYLGIKRPDHLKIDVDGIKHLVLRGGRGALTSVQSVLIEVDERFDLQVEKTDNYLTEAGLTMVPSFAGMGSPCGSMVGWSSARSMAASSSSLRTCSSSSASASTLCHPIPTFWFR